METTGAITRYAAYFLSQTGSAEAPAQAIGAAAEVAAEVVVPVVATSGSSVFGLVGQSGPIVTAVLVILIAFSVISWAIILYKTIQLKKAARASARFLDAFWNANDLADMFEQRAAYAASPIAKVFVAGYKELVRMHESRQGKSGQPHSLVESMSGLAPIERAMHRTASAEVTQLEALVPFLATTGSTAPFIGLFGTVWGIMNSFHEISAMKSASIAVVAPGISEALIATATGLAAAIPAVMAYNYFVARIRVLDGEISHFVSDFLNLVENSVPGVNDTAPDPQAQRRARATQHGA